jgi:uncharacterized protein (DUF2249 family)
MATPLSSSTPSGTLDADTVFDVRPIPCRVKHGLIFQRWLDLPVGQFFILLNDHDPVPLRYQFEAEFPDSFSWDYVERGPEEFRVKITKLKATALAGPLPTGCGSHDAEAAPAGADGVLDVDARGLEPPEPLIRILDALERLPAGASLRAHTDREPCHLFGEATNRGFRHDCQAQPDGSWITLLTRA